MGKKLGQFVLSPLEVFRNPPRACCPKASTTVPYTYSLSAPKRLTLYSLSPGELAVVLSPLRLQAYRSRIRRVVAAAFTSDVYRSSETPARRGYTIRVSRPISYTLTIPHAPTPSVMGICKPRFEFTGWTAGRARLVQLCAEHVECMSKLEQKFAATCWWE